MRTAIGFTQQHNRLSGTRRRVNGNLGVRRRVKRRSEDAKSDTALSVNSSRLRAPKRMGAAVRGVHRSGRHLLEFLLAWTERLVGGVWVLSQVGVFAIVIVCAAGSLTSSEGLD